MSHLKHSAPPVNLAAPSQFWTSRIIFRNAAIHGTAKGNRKQGTAYGGPSSGPLWHADGLIRVHVCLMSIWREGRKVPGGSCRIGGPVPDACRSTPGHCADGSVGAQNPHRRSARPLWQHWFQTTSGANRCHIIGADTGFSGLRWQIANRQKLAVLGVSFQQGQPPGQVMIVLLAGSFKRAWHKCHYGQPFPPRLPALGAWRSCFSPDQASLMSRGPLQVFSDARAGGWHTGPIRCRSSPVGGGSVETEYGFR